MSQDFPESERERDLRDESEGKRKSITETTAENDEKKNKNFAVTQDRNMHTSLLFVFSFNSPIRTLFTDWNYTQLCFRGAWQQQKNHTREYQINELNQQASFLPLGFFGVFILHSQMYTGANFLRSCYSNQKFAVLFQWEKGRRYQCSSSSCTTIRPLHQARLLAHTLGRTNTFAFHWAIMCDIIYNQSNDISFLCSQRTTLQQGTSYQQITCMKCLWMFWMLAWVLTWLITTNT